MKLIDFEMSKVKENEHTPQEYKERNEEDDIGCNAEGHKQLTEEGRVLLLAFCRSYP